MAADAGGPARSFPVALGPARLHFAFGQIKPMPKLKLILVSVVVAILTNGCGPRRDLAARVQSGDSLRTFSISGFTNGVPIAVTISDTESLRFITEGIRHASDSAAPGNVFQADVSLASGYRENIMLMVKEGGQEITLGTGEGLLKEPTWHTLSLSKEAPPRLATNMFYLGISYK